MENRSGIAWRWRFAWSARPLWHGLAGRADCWELTWRCSPQQGGFMAMFWPMLPTKADPGFRVMWRVSENGGYLILGSCFLSGSYYMRVPYFRKLPCAGTWPCLRLDHAGPGGVLPRAKIVASWPPLKGPRSGSRQTTPSAQSSSKSRRRMSAHNAMALLSST